MRRDAGNLKAVINEIFADDVVWRYPGDNPLAGDYRGKEGVTAFFRQLREVTNGKFQLELVNLLANDDCVMALEAPQAERKGRAFAWNSVLVYFFRGGKIREVYVFQHQQHQLDEFWS
jgi:ketosteroid isomerase-like protein